MKNKIKIIFLLIVAIMAVMILPIVKEYTRSTKSGTDIEIIIEKGSSIKTIAKILKENGVINNEFAFVSKVKHTKNINDLKYGKFLVNTGMSLSDIIDVLSGNGIMDVTKITIPEGFSVERIAERLENSGLCTKNEFFDALNDEYEYDFINEIPDDLNYNYKLQGFLFPNTYEFYKDSTAHTIIDTMLKEFEKQYSGLKNNNVNLSLYDIVTIASLVEREAKLDNERGTISGVIYNRLDKGMLLQIDATVVYAISNGLYDVERVLYKDLEIDSPYNTYKYAGLPEGPICNPGKESIRAALEPEKHSYLYYHTDETKNDGSHIFTETFNQHISTK